MKFEDALNLAHMHGLTRRTRLRYDELAVLCGLFKDATSYIEVGVYDGLSAFMISATTNIEYIYLIDIVPLRNNLASLITNDLNVVVYNHVGDFVTVPPITKHKYNWCLLDADHSYEATKLAYALFKNSAYTIVIHDVEMPGPNQLFKEIGGVKIVSSDDTFMSPDGKLLPPLGYAILSER